MLNARLNNGNVVLLQERNHSNVQNVQANSLATASWPNTNVFIRASTRMNVRYVQRNLLKKVH